MAIKDGADIGSKDDLRRTALHKSRHKSSNFGDWEVDSETNIQNN